MSLLFKTLALNFAPPGITGTPGGVIDSPDKSMSKEDVMEFLGADDDTEGEDKIDLDDKGDKNAPKPKGRTSKEDEDTSKDEDADKDEDDEDKDSEDTDDDEDEDVERTLEDELEDELEDVTEEKLNLVTPVRRAEILKKYPKLFKDFPYLETAYYREQAFTEMFPTMDDAKESQAKAQTLDSFEADLMNGSTEKTFLAVKSDPKSFAKMIDNLMPTLMKVDEQAYHHIIGNVVKECVIGMVNEARSSENEALQQAAAILNQFVFGSSKFSAPKKLIESVENEADTRVNSELAKVQKEREDFNNQKFTDAKAGIDTRVSNALKSTIEHNIDKKDEMTPYVKRNAIREASDEINKLMNGDKRFKTIIDKLWERARKNGMDKRYVEEIRSTKLTKAKQLLPSVIKKARLEALKGMGKRVREERDDNDKEDMPPRNAKRRATNDDDSEQPRSRTSGKSKGIPAGMSTLDFLLDGD